MEKIMYNGKAYRKVAREFKEGDLIYAIRPDHLCNDYQPGYITKIYKEGEELRFDDEKGDFRRVHGYGHAVNFMVLEEIPTLKVGDIAKVIELVNSKPEIKIGDIVEITDVDGDGDYWAKRVSDGETFFARARRLVKATAEEIEAVIDRRLPIGTYGVITQVGITRGIFSPHGFKLGQVVKVTKYGDFCNDRVGAISLDNKDFWFVHNDDIRKATAEEVAEATKPKLEVGATVKLTIAAGKEPRFGWGKVKNGDVGKVTFIYHDSVIVDFPAQDHWNTDPSELTVLTEEEAAKLRKEAEQIAAWAKIGRKPGEYKKGDIVRVTKQVGTVKVGEIGVVGNFESIFFRVDMFDVRRGNFHTKHSVELVAPVEAVVNLKFEE